ncbi:hypothetical protein DL93DRAFT_986057 [Clavulina sp. PMI_390]|nr:hypothetical protein DL93DRAFT_986057 [Clavulina sp. PMI_390]
MESSISDPYHLATYSAPPGVLPSSPPVTTTFTSVPGEGEGWVTATVQGDGIHIIELTSLQPVASHTLGPSTFFSAPAVTVIVSTKDPGGAVVRKRKTYAAIAPNESSSQLQSQELWSWENEISSTIAPSIPKKESMTVPHDIRELLPSPTGEILVAVSSTGRQSSINTASDILVASLDKPAEQCEVLQSWIFPQRQVTFLRSKHSSGTCAIVHLVRISNAYQLNVDLCEGTGLFTHNCVIAVPGPREVRAFYLILLRIYSRKLLSIKSVRRPWDSRGTFPVSVRTDQVTPTHKLTKSPIGPEDDWQYYRISPPDPDSSKTFSSSPIMRPVGQPISMVSSSSGISPLPVSSSRVLIASTSASSSPSTSGTSRKLSLDLQLWDVKYGVPIAVFSAGLPSGSSISDLKGQATPALPRLKLTAATSGHAILTILPPAPPTLSVPASGSKKRSSTSAKKREQCSILVIPYHVVKTSTLVEVMRSRMSNPAIGAIPTSRPAISATEASAQQRRIALLDIMRASSKDKSDSASAAVDAFWKWCDAESLLQRKAKTTEPVEPNRSKTSLPRSFVVAIVAILAQVPPSIEAWTIWRPIMEYLLVQRHALTNNILGTQGGVVRLLIEQSDWLLVRRCFQILPDLSEDEAMRTLRIVVDASLMKKKSKQSEAMDVDTSTSQNLPSWAIMPSLSEFLPIVISYPLTEAYLRPAIRAHFNDVEALLPIFNLFIKRWQKGADFDWLEAKPLIRFDRYGRKVEYAESSSEKKGQIEEGDDQNGNVDKPPRSLEETLNVFSVLKTANNKAPLETTLAFLEVMLDASFLDLVQHPKGKKIISSFEELIKPELDLTVVLGGLRGLLEPFSRIQKPISKTENETTPEESVAKKHARDTNAVVKIYQVEELEL